MLGLRRAVCAVRWLCDLFCGIGCCGQQRPHSTVGAADPTMPPMTDRAARIAPLAETLEARLIALKPGEPGLREAIARARADLAAFRFHLHHPGTPALLVIVGGTGTGKSTLLNRLLGERVSATSYRRTFTAGPIAVQLGAAQAPEGWLGVEHVIAQELPARGHPDALVIVKADGWRTAASSETAAAAPAVLLVDTPDLDGDQPAHH